MGWEANIIRLRGSKDDEWGKSTSINDGEHGAAKLKNPRRREQGGDRVMGPRLRREKLRQELCSTRRARGAGLVVRVSSKGKAGTEGELSWVCAKQIER